MKVTQNSVTIRQWSRNHRFPAISIKDEKGEIEKRNYNSHEVLPNTKKYPELPLLGELKRYIEPAATPNAAENVGSMDGLNPMHGDVGAKQEDVPVVPEVWKNWTKGEIAFLLLRDNAIHRKVKVVVDEVDKCVTPLDKEVKWRAKVHRLDNQLLPSALVRGRFTLNTHVRFDDL